VPQHGSFLRKRRRPGVVALVVAGTLLAAVTLTWGVDAAAGGDVVRNVELDGTSVGGQERAELDASVAAYATELASAPVRLVTPEATYDTTAADLGLGVDAEATAEAVLDAGRGFPLLRPFGWVASFVRPLAVDPVLTVAEVVAAATIVALEGDARTLPIEPTMAVDGDGRVVLVPGVPGSGLLAADVADRLPEAVLAGSDPITVEVTPAPLPPATGDETVQAVVDQANLITDVGLAVTVEDETTDVDAPTLRTWLRLVPGDGGGPTLTVDQDAAIATLADRFPGLGDPPVDASFTLEDGRPVLVPGVSGTGCCATDSAARLLEAMQAGTGSVELTATPREPDFTTAEAESWGVVEQVGGTRAWPESRTGEVGPGFTTFHASGEARVTNIHRIADLVRGAVIPPGGSFSVNDYVGRRTVENGFVAAGAIRNGEHVSEVGGGVSQFATTLFNAAYFAGLDIDEYQAHSEYFSRYPRGREATMGFPAPDLVITNDTPYGVLIWTSYTGGSLTVTMYSTTYATAEQTDIREGTSGNCAVVTTTRTRTYPDREPETDEFRATYRPGEGQFC
jgi:vancomycin resistance protein YoaR